MNTGLFFSFFSFFFLFSSNITFSLRFFGGDGFFPPVSTYDEYPHTTGMLFLHFSPTFYSAGSRSKVEQTCFLFVPNENTKKERTKVRSQKALSGQKCGDEG